MAVSKTVRCGFESQPSAPIYMQTELGRFLGPPAKRRALKGVCFEYSGLRQLERWYYLNFTPLGNAWIKISKIRIFGFK